MRIGIIGAGAIGSVVGGMLTKAGRGTRWLWLVPFGFRPRTSLLLVSLRIWLGRQRSFSLLTACVPSCFSESPGPT